MKKLWLTLALDNLSVLSERLLFVNLNMAGIKPAWYKYHQKWKRQILNCVTLQINKNLEIALLWDSFFFKRQFLKLLCSFSNCFKASYNYISGFIASLFASLLWIRENSSSSNSSCSTETIHLGFQGSFIEIQILWRKKATIIMNSVFFNWHLHFFIDKLPSSFHHTVMFCGKSSTTKFLLKKLLFGSQVFSL